MACAALVQVGPARQSLLGAVHARGRAPAGAHATAAARRAAAACDAATPGRAAGRAIGERAARPGSSRKTPASQARCPHGAGQVWTRKQAGMRAHGTLALDGGAPRVDRGAGGDRRHRRTTTRARPSGGGAPGVGAGADGAALAWNLVSGVNDPPTGQRARGVGRRRAARDAAGAVRRGPERRSAARGRLAAALRRRGASAGASENLLLVRSDYRAPFGTFSGTLPGGIALARGLGVMEHHRARW